MSSDPLHEPLTIDATEPSRVREDPPWTIWDVIRIAVIAIIAIGLFTTIGLGIVAHGQQSKEVLKRIAKVAIPAQILAYLVVIAYMVAIIRVNGRPFWQTVKWNFPATAAMGYGALGIALAILVQEISALLPIPKQLPIDKYFSDVTSAYLMAFFGVTFAPLLEELFFRGFLYPVVARRLGMAASVVITAVLFAFIHEAQLAQSWGPLLLLCIVGVALTWIRAWRQSVGASFCVHVGYNLTLFTLMYLASDHFRHLEKLT